MELPNVETPQPQELLHSTEWKASLQIQGFCEISEVEFSVGVEGVQGTVVAVQNLDSAEFD
jgi:hypothetical protein